MKNPTLSALTVVLLALGCGKSQSGSLPEGGVPSDASPDRGSASDENKTYTRYAFTWIATWGPCQPENSPCREEFCAQPDGTLVHRLRDTYRTAPLNAADLAELRAFVEDPALREALADPTPCTTEEWFDREETVVLTPVEGIEVSKSVLMCKGFPYDSINEWTKRFAAYFP